MYSEQNKYVEKNLQHNIMLFIILLCFEYITIETHHTTNKSNDSTKRYK